MLAVNISILAGAGHSKCPLRIPESVVAVCLDSVHWRSPRFLTRTCRREDQTRAKPNIRPVNIVHPSSPSNGLLHVLKFVIQ